MLTVICSTEQIESMEYYLRSSGVADVYLRKNIQKQDMEDSGQHNTTQYTADEVYFAVTGEKASKESIEKDFDYWYNKGEEIAQGELADRYSLEELRMQAYSNASEACEKTIYAGIDVEISTGTEHFSLTEKDQINLFGKKMQLLAGEEKLEYHEDGQPCKYFSAEDMQNIVNKAMFYVSYYTTYCNALNMWIKSVTKPGDLDQIQWGAKVPEEFQNEVLKDYMKTIASGGIA